MSHLAYLMGTILALTSFMAIGLAFLYLSPTPIHLWLAGFIVWLVVLFRSKR